MRREVATILAAIGATDPVLPTRLKLAPGKSTVDGEPGEPTYNKAVRTDIQGNILPGFNKDHQHFLFLRIEDPVAAKAWLKQLAPQITTMDDVLTFVRAHRSERLRTGVAEPPLNSTWINVAFSYPGLVQLVGTAEADRFGEASFRQGLAERSTYLGDPTDPDAAGQRASWVVGGPDAEADILLIVAADETADLESAVQRLRDTATGVTVLFQQRGDTLPETLRGHEHFGFKDGISQPGVRGRVTRRRGDLLTTRYLDSTDPHARLFGRPGQALVWPGQFLLGEPRQHTQHRLEQADTVASGFPDWARRGSYLVCRRLRQDVVAFWDFVVSAAQPLGVDPVRFASLLVGRWPSGAPVSRVPGADDPALGGDPFANNDVRFDDDTGAAVLAALDGYPGDSYPRPVADLLGRVCPHFAHVRTINPRDDPTDLGATADTLTRLILRRGIPYGAPLVGVARPSAGLVQQERGLMFLCYAATIEDQFEFLVRRWANSAVQPNVGGHDPVMGQTERYGVRDRHLDVPLADGTTRRLVLPAEWVTPTGGGYFFAPPIRALTTVLAS